MFHGHIVYGITYHLLRETDKVHTYQLTLKCRDSGQVLELTNDQYSRLGSEGYQSLLHDLYRRYNVLCHCHGLNDLVEMHIRCRQADSFYFLADNPTSQLHADNCSFFSHRQRVEGKEPTLGFVPFTPVQAVKARVIVSDTRRVRSPGARNSALAAKQLLTKLESLLVTLLCSAFIDFSFGRYINLPQVHQKIVNNRKNQSILYEDLTSLVSVLHYGQKGLNVAISNLKTMQGKLEENQQASVFWLGQKSEFLANQHTIELAGKTFDIDQIRKPYPAKGPYLLFGELVEADEPKFRELLVMPVVSMDTLMVVHTDEQRHFIKEIQPWLFGINNSKSHMTYCQKPLIPIVDEGEKRIADFVLVRKDKQYGTKQSLVIAESYQSQIAELYDAQVATLNITQVQDWYRASAEKDFDWGA